MRLKLWIEALRKAVEVEVISLLEDEALDRSFEKSYCSKGEVLEKFDHCSIGDFMPLF